MRTLGINDLCVSVYRDIYIYKYMFLSQFDDSRYVGQLVFKVRTILVYDIPRPIYITKFD